MDSQGVVSQELRKARVHLSGGDIHLLLKQRGLLQLHLRTLEPLLAYPSIRGRTTTEVTLWVLQ